MPLTAAGILEKMLEAGGGAVGSGNGKGLQRGGQGFVKGRGGGGFERRKLTLEAVGLTELDGQCSPSPGSPPGLRPVWQGEFCLRLDLGMRREVVGLQGGRKTYSRPHKQPSLLNIIET